MTALLGGLDPATFLGRHWQKRPLLVRQAVPGFTGFLDRDAVLSLACRDDAVSRLLIERPGRAERFERHDGPFGGLEAGMLPKRRWTILVHGVESLVPGGWELLRRFSFVPFARIDDLMVSWAADGGSVGAHEDLYDVFLLQGEGRRRWRVAGHDWILEPGDMLYLPPRVRHWGVAVGPCLTYSIGFLAPTRRDLVTAFVGYLAGTLRGGDRQYRDPDLRPTADPLAIDDAMLAQVASLLELRWDDRVVEDFFGRFLTRPKPHVRFAPPRRALGRADLARRLRGRGRLTLALPSRGLVRPGRIFLNGDGWRASRATAATFRRLVLERGLDLPVRLEAPFVALVEAWHGAGWLRL